MDKDLIIQLQQEQLRQYSILVRLLEERVSELENNQKKDSSNSSKPPSTDIGKPKRTKSLRPSTDKRPGGQAGHTGSTLLFSDHPDEIIVHEVLECYSCSRNLSRVNAMNTERRQVYDIPPVQLMVTEHQAVVKQCPHCHQINRAAFPAGISQPVQYGERMQALGVYLNQYQLLPYHRTAQLFSDLFGHSPSVACLVNNNQRFASRLSGFKEELKEVLRNQPVLHADETGFYYEGKRNWLHCLSTEHYVLYAAHAKRGGEAMQEMDILSRYKGTLVHDFWKPYNEFTCKHALCNVHHLRDLTFCHEVENSSWAYMLIKYLVALNKKVAAAKENGQTSLSAGVLKYWISKFNALLKLGKKLHPPPVKRPNKRGATAKSKTQNMLHRFIHCKEQVLAFAKNFEVPFGNNIAEQSIRMMKVKQKISGCFRSQQGAQDFAITRSYIATARKQGYSVIEAITSAIQGTPGYILA